MEFTKVKTKKQLLREQGLPIWYCKVTVKVKKKDVYSDRIVHIVYKELTFNPNEDVYFCNRIKKVLGFERKVEINVKKVEKLISLGYGKYEEL